MVYSIMFGSATIKNFNVLTPILFFNDDFPPEAVFLILVQYVTNNTPSYRYLARWNRDVGPM